MFFFRFNAAAPRSFIKQAIEIGLGALYLVNIFFATSSKCGWEQKNKNLLVGFRRWGGLGDLFFSLFFPKVSSSQEFCLVWLCLWFSFVFVFQLVRHPRIDVLFFFCFLFVIVSISENHRIAIVNMYIWCMRSINYIKDCYILGWTWSE